MMHGVPALHEVSTGRALLAIFLPLVIIVIIAAIIAADLLIVMTQAMR